MLGRLFDVAARIAREAGIAENGYRMATNVGRDGGQTVDHLHFHLMGGRSFSWPPG
jgi:histidine triad (HIT) family protein